MVPLHRAAQATYPAAVLARVGPRLLLLVEAFKQRWCWRQIQLEVGVGTCWAEVDRWHIQLLRTMERHGLHSTLDARLRLLGVGHRRVFAYVLHPAVGHREAEALLHRWWRRSLPTIVVGGV